VLGVWAVGCPVFVQRDVGSAALLGVSRQIVAPEKPRAADRLGHVDRFCNVQATCDRAWLGRRP